MSSLFAQHRGVRALAQLAGLLWLAVAAAPAHSQAVLFQDEFNDSTFDPRHQWDLYGTDRSLGRTQWGLVPTMGQEGITSFARLRLDTYNPDPDFTGELLKGTEILSRNAFKLGTGVEFEMRLRGENVPRGVDYGTYTYAQRGRWPDGYLKEEIDFEVLTNLPRDQFWSNIWDDWNLRYGYDDGVHTHETATQVNGMDYTQWTTYKARWYPDRVEWWIDGKLTRTSTDIVPDDPMDVRFNIWAVQEDWHLAYDAGLQPTDVASQNRPYYMDADYVHVKRLPAPSGVWGTGDGLRAQLWNNTTLSGTPTVQRVDARVNHDWSTFSPDVNIPNDHFSARWTGQLLAPRTETYTISVQADDGVRLWLDNRLVIDQWKQQSATEYSTTVNFTAGSKHAIRLEYYEDTGDASVRLLWRTPTIAKSPIPQCQLYSGDVTPPSLQITTPTAGTTYKSLPQALGTAGDPASDGWNGRLDRVMLRLQRKSDNLWWNGSAWTSTRSDLITYGMTNWNRSLPALTDGIYEISAFADDLAGNRTTVGPVRFNIVTNSLKVAITSPVAGGRVGSPANFTGTATAAIRINLGIQRVSDNFYWNGTGWQSGVYRLLATGTTNWRLTVSNLPAGSYRASALARNAAGAQLLSSVVNFTVDRGGPQLTVTTPADDFSYASVARATGTASDPAGVRSVSLTLQRLTDNLYWTGSVWSGVAAALPATLSSGNWSRAFPALNAGQYRIRITGTDNLGNTSSLASGFWIDTVAPTVAITSPVNGRTYSSLTTVTGTARDAGPGTSAVTLALQRPDGRYWNGASWDTVYSEVTATRSGSVGSITWTYHLPALTAGRYTLRARARDFIGNSRQTSAVVFTIGASAGSGASVESF